MAKWLFFNNLVTQCHKVTNADDKNSRRTYSRQYCLPVDGVKVRVCKVMFIATLDISEGQIITAQKKGKGSPDKRGLNISRPKTINPELKQSVRDHIQSLPRMESHYIRKESGREYLNSGIESISQMYDIYIEWMPCNFPDVPLATYRQYADIFNTEFNLSFFLCKKDQCDLCVEYGNATEARRAELQEEYAIHDKNKTLAQELRLADNQVAKTDKTNTVAVICFDYEKTLICPKAKASIFYYKWKLSVNNFTIVKAGRMNEEVCYVYDETVAHKGSNEVASFLYHFLVAKIQEGYVDFRLYCDNCWGQNKNRAVAALLAYIVAKFQEKNLRIVLRFLEKGHSYNAADTIHSLIEKKTRKRDIYTPAQWYECIRTSKRSKTNPIKVIEVQQFMVVDWKELADKLNLHKDTEGSVVPFTKIRQISADSSTTYQLEFKARFDISATKIISLKKIGKPVNFQTYTLSNVYNNGPFPIAQSKMEDLLYYCNHSLIPQEHQNFFRGLTSGSTDDEAAMEVSFEEAPNGRARKRRTRQTKR